MQSSITILKENKQTIKKKKKKKKKRTKESVDRSRYSEDRDCCRLGGALDSFDYGRFDRQAAPRCLVECRAWTSAFNVKHETK
ncbi:hypothetical protein PUN28_007964 [Cardiocondyla obscurior]|uniref:Uncharacterized protein n=1 Tax=Cardiocondyla obscurior TaxID=286306 RepID=A0AAW2FYF9_9HYME